MMQWSYLCADDDLSLSQITISNLHEEQQELMQPLRDGCQDYEKGTRHLQSMVVVGYSLLSTTICGNDLQCRNLQLYLFLATFMRVWNHFSEHRVEATRRAVLKSREIKEVQLDDLLRHGAVLADILEGSKGRIGLLMLLDSSVFDWYVA